MRYKAFYGVILSGVEGFWIEFEASNRIEARQKAENEIKEQARKEFAKITKNQKHIQVVLIETVN